MKDTFNKSSFKLFLSASIGLHLVIILVFVFSKNLVFKKDKNLLIENSIQIDHIGLPDLEQKKEKTILKTKTKVFKKNEKLKPKKPKINPKLLKKNENKKESDKKENSKKEIKKGNKLSQGAETGNELLNSQQMSDISQYASQISNQVRSRWNLPNYLTDKRRITQIEIQINSDGKIIYKQILSSSGHELYDSFVLKAIELASPYPKPPDSILNFIKSGIVLTFSSQ